MNILGRDYYNIIAYQNITNSNSDKNINYINYKNNKIYTGIKWQCVEYVRRWYIQVLQLSFPSIENAIDLWNIPYVYDTITNKQHRFYSIVNGSNLEPKPADILVFKHSKIYPYGHVAIITRVTKDTIYLAEQNFSDTKWTRPYSRKIKRRLDIIMDPLVLGWKTIGY